jgi:hypothetical protein
MSKKYLIACGDSFTEGHVLGKPASWATYVGPKLGLETINIACGGMSNDWICNTTLTWLMKNKEKAKDSVVMIGWTEFGRQHTIYQPINGLLQFLQQILYLILLILTIMIFLKH